MKILNHTQIEQKIIRLAYEIAEYNYDAPILHLVGINNNGMRLAKLLRAELDKINVFPTELHAIRLSPANPLEKLATLDCEIDTLADQHVLIVDDVAKTGRTLFYAFAPFFHTIPAKVQCAVLVDRKHKRFPVNVDFVGLSLATTLKENISVKLIDENNMEAYLI